MIHVRELNLRWLLLLNRHLPWISGIPRALRHRERASTHQIMPVFSRQFECYTDSGLERILSRLHLCQMHFLSL